MMRRKDTFSNSPNSTSPSPLRSNILKAISKCFMGATIQQTKLHYTHTHVHTYNTHIHTYIHIHIHTQMQYIQQNCKFFPAEKFFALFIFCQCDATMRIKRHQVLIIKILLCCQLSQQKFLMAKCLDLKVSAFLIFTAIDLKISTSIIDIFSRPLLYSKFFH